jgi:hypothetical protein
MKLRGFVLVGACIFALAAPIAFAQAPLKGTVDFPFTAGTKKLPPGTYDLIWHDNTQTFLVTDNGKNESLVPVVTRVVNMMPDMSAVVFDVVGDKYVLSEVWMPGLDGFIVATTKVAHRHKIVGMTK